MMGGPLSLKTYFRVGHCDLVGLFVMYKSAYGAKGPRIHGGRYKMYVLFCLINIISDWGQY